MPWFLVDDQFHSHPKALATEPAALGLWAVAGSWSSAHLTDGVVPDDVLPRLFPDAVKLAEALVDAGLWRRVKSGYKFIQDGTCKIQAKSLVERERKQATERQRRRRGGVSSRRDSTVTHAEVRDPGSSTSTTPNPAAGAAGNRAGPCPTHGDQPRGNCRRCGTNPRGRPPPSPAEQHPSSKTLAQALAQANPS